jgi:hypothetical protein
MHQGNASVGQAEDARYAGVRAAVVALSEGHSDSDMCRAELQAVAAEQAVDPSVKRFVQYCLSFLDAGLLPPMSVYGTFQCTYKFQGVLPEPFLLSPYEDGICVSYKGATKVIWPGVSPFYDVSDPPSSWQAARDALGPVLWGLLVPYISHMRPRDRDVWRRSVQDTVPLARTQHVVLDTLCSPHCGVSAAWAALIAAGPASMAAPVVWQYPVTAPTLVVRHADTPAAVAALVVALLGHVLNGRGLKGTPNPHAERNVALTLLMQRSRTYTNAWAGTTITERIRAVLTATIDAAATPTLRPQEEAQRWTRGRLAWVWCQA